MSIINPVCPTCLTRTCTHPEAMEMLHEQIRAANVDMFASLPPTTGQTDPTPDTVSALESAADTPAGPTHSSASRPSQRRAWNQAAMRTVIIGGKMDGSQ